MYRNTLIHFPPKEARIANGCVFCSFVYLIDEAKETKQTYRNNNNCISNLCIICFADNLVEASGHSCFRWREVHQSIAIDSFSRKFFISFRFHSVWVIALWAVLSTQKFWYFQLNARYLHHLFRTNEIDKHVEILFWHVKWISAN